MPTQTPHHEMIVLTRFLDGREQQRIKIPRVAESAFEPFFRFPQLFGAVAEGRTKITWEMSASNLVEEIGAWIITHPDQLPAELRAAMKRDMELPEWLGI